MRHLLGLRTALDEDEAFLAAGELPDGVRGLADVGAEVEPQIPLGLGLRRVDEAKRAPARPLQPLADDERVADGRREADALDVAPRERDQPLEKAREVRAAILGSESVHLADDDRREPLEERLSI